jgi:hypothetical protein
LRQPIEGGSLPAAGVHGFWVSGEAGLPMIVISGKFSRSWAQAGIAAATTATMAVAINAIGRRS